MLIEIDEDAAQRLGERGRRVGRNRPRRCRPRRPARCRGDSVRRASVQPARLTRELRRTAFGGEPLFQPGGGRSFPDRVHPTNRGARPRSRSPRRPPRVWTSAPLLFRMERRKVPEKQRISVRAAGAPVAAVQSRASGEASFVSMRCPELTVSECGSSEWVGTASARSGPAAEKPPTAAPAIDAASRDRSNAGFLL